MKKKIPDLELKIEGNLETEELLSIIKKQLEDNKINNIKVLKLKDKSFLASYTVIGSGTSSKHISAAAEKLADKVEEAYGESQDISMEGMNKNAKWILIDLNDIIVHLFTEEMREIYNLEELYSK